MSIHQSISLSTDDVMSHVVGSVSADTGVPAWMLESPDAGEIPLPPTLAKEAAPYLRKIFAIMNDPKISDRCKSAEYGVPEHLQAFVSEYMTARGHRIKFSVGPLTKKHYVTVLAAGE